MAWDTFTINSGRYAVEISYTVIKIMSKPTIGRHFLSSTYNIKSRYVLFYRTLPIIFVFVLYTHNNIYLYQAIYKKNANLKYNMEKEQ